MNVYEKLQNVRVELQKMKLAKTGQNQSMKYFELGDFLPAVNALCLKHGLVTRLSIIPNNTETAVLTVYNASEPKERIDFTCPTAEATLPKGQAIQNLGAKITYLRRYMLMTAFEIVESDIVEKVSQELSEEVEEKDLEKIKNTGSQEELTELYKEMKGRYKASLLVPVFKNRKLELSQGE